MRETRKVFNRIPLLALVNNRTRQNDGRISLQKQTSNNERQSNLTKRGITMSFVSENVLLFDSKSFRRQECSLTLWSRNQLIAWFYVFRVLFWRVSCVARKHFPQQKFTLFWRSFLRQFTYVICIGGILNNGTWWKKRFSSPTCFCNGREHIAFSHGQKLLSNQFLYNLHFIEDEESMKEHTLVRFPLMYYLWNAKRAKVFNFRPVMTRSIDSRGWKRKVRFSRK